MPIPIRRISFIIVSLILLCYSITAQTFPMRIYTVDDGLATNVVDDAVQDRIGRIWFSTEIGVSVYDGSSWKNYSDEAGLLRNEYIQITKDSRDYIWTLPINDHNCICYFDGKKWNSLPRLTLSSRKYRFTSFAVYYSKKITEILVGSTEGIYTFRNGIWTKLIDTSGKLNCDIFSIKEFGQKFYIASRNGLFTYDLNGQIENLTPRLKLDTNEILGIDLTLSSLNELRDQKICWILTRNCLGYLNLSANTFTKVGDKNPLKFIPRNKFYFIKYDNNQRIYYGNEQSKYYYDFRFGKNSRLNMENGFSTTGNSNVLIDRENNVWFLSTRGIDKLSNLFFTSYNRSTGFEEDEVTTIREMSPGKFFLGHNYGFTIFTPHSQNYFNIENKIQQNASNCRIIDAAKDSIGNLWFTAGYLGIGCINQQGTLRWYTTKNSVQFGAVVFNKKGKPFFGSDSGLFTLANAKLQRLQPQSYSSALIRKLLAGSDGNIYSTAISGFSKYNSEGILTNSYIDNSRSNSFYALCEYKNNILVGKPEGLFVFINDHFQVYPLGKDTIRQKIFFAEIDTKGNLWLGTDDGVIKWDGIKLKKFSKENGLMGRETNRSGFCSDSFGRVWIGTERGLSCYSPDYDKDDFPPVITNIHLTDQNRNQFPISSGSKTEPELSYNQNTFHLHYNIISFKNEDWIRCRIQLVGFDKNPVDYTNKNSVRYTNLSPGSYYFLIQAQNFNGEWSKTHKTASFVIQGPFYQKWWFILLILVTISSTGYWIYVYTYNTRYAAQLEIEVKSRTAELFNSEQKIRSIVENAPYLIMMINKENIITYLNKSEAPFIQTNSLNTSFPDYFADAEKNSLIHKMNQLFHNKIPVYGEYNFAPIIGRDLWMEYYINPIIYDSEVNEAIAILINRTGIKQSEIERIHIEKERKIAFELLQNSLAEKEILLNEVYHRVGNNLQVISSLLYMQSISIENTELQSLFQESLSRVKSMSLVHEILYKSKDLKNIKVSDYTTNLANFLSDSYKKEKKVSLTLDLDETIIEVDKAIPFGLIINELVSNSIKYGIPIESDSKQELFISVKQIGDNIISIIHDNGPGIPESKGNFALGTTLGIKLVNLLITQLKGELSYEFQKGAKITIIFPTSKDADA